MGIATMLGSPIKRREDPRLITGQATYVDDIKLLGMLHMAGRGRPHLHVRIYSINAPAARQLPGVLGVYTEGALEESGGDITTRLVNQRLAPMSIETRGVVAEFRKADKTLTIWSSSQIPHLLRDILAATVGLPQHQVRVIVPEVGGGFGSKLNVYPEELWAPYVTMNLGLPLSRVEDRSEALAATIHGRDQVDYVEAAETRDGTMTR